MPISKTSSLILVASAAALFVPSASAVVTYSMTVLPRVPGTIATMGSSLNAEGEVVGIAYTENMEQKAFVYTAGTSSVLPGMTVGRSRAMGINDLGQVVGYHQDLITGENKAFVYSAGDGVKHLGNLGGPDAIAMGINNKGQVVGHSDITPLYTGPYRAFVHDGISMSAIPLTVPGSTDSFATAINSSDTIVGDVFTPQGLLGFLYTKGSTTLIGQPGGLRYSPTAISDSGLVVGSFWLADGSTHAFLFDGTPHDLGTLADPGSLGYGLGTSSYSGATSVNSLGQAVGVFGYSGYSGRAFVYRDGSMLNLQDLVAEPNGWVFTEAMDINEAGQILVNGYRTGEFISTALVLTPTVAVPEPAAWLLCGIGASVVGSTSRRRKRPSGPESTRHAYSLALGIGVGQAFGPADRSSPPWPDLSEADGPHSTDNSDRPSPGVGGKRLVPELEGRPGRR